MPCLCLGCVERSSALAESRIRICELALLKFALSLTYSSAFIGFDMPVIDKLAVDLLSLSTPVEPCAPLEGEVVGRLGTLRAQQCVTCPPGLAGYTCRSWL